MPRRKSKNKSTNNLIDKLKQPEPIVEPSEPIIHTPASIMTKYKNDIERNIKFYAYDYENTHKYNDDNDDDDNDDDNNDDDDVDYDHDDDLIKQMKMNKMIRRETTNTLCKLRPEIKVNVHCKQHLEESVLQKIYAYVNKFSELFYELYPHLMLDEIFIDVIFNENGNYTINNGVLPTNANIYKLFEYISFSYHNEVVTMSKIELSDCEKIYLSKLKLFQLNLKNNLNELKIMPIESGQSKISFVGEDYREAMKDFYDNVNANINTNNIIHEY